MEDEANRGLALNNAVDDLIKTLRDQIDSQRAALADILKATNAFENAEKVLSEKGEQFLDDALETSNRLSASALSLTESANTVADLSGEIAEGQSELVKEMSERLNAAESRHQASVNTLISALTAIKAIEVELMDAGSDLRRMGEGGVERLNTSSAAIGTTVSKLTQLVDRLTSCESQLNELIAKFPKNR